MGLPYRTDRLIQYGAPHPTQGVDLSARGLLCGALRLDSAFGDFVNRPQKPPKPSLDIWP